MICKAWHDRILHDFLDSVRVVSDAMPYEAALQAAVQMRADDESSSYFVMGNKDNPAEACVVRSLVW